MSGANRESESVSLIHTASGSTRQAKIKNEMRTTEQTQEKDVAIFARRQHIAGLHTSEK